MPNAYRRKVLKGISISAVAALAPLSSLAAARPGKSMQQIAMYIDEKHGRFKASTSNEIINTGNRPVVLKTGEPVGYKRLNGKNLAFYINSPDEARTLQPGDRFKVHARSININPPKSLLIQNYKMG